MRVILEKKMVLLIVITVMMKMKIIQCVRQAVVMSKQDNQNRQYHQSQEKLHIDGKDVSPCNKQLH